MAQLQVSGRAAPAGCVTGSTPRVPTLTGCCPGAPSTLPCPQQCSQPGWPRSSCPHTHGQAAPGHCPPEPCTSGTPWAFERTNTNPHSSPMGEGCVSLPVCRKEGREHRGSCQKFPSDPRAQHGTLGPLSVLGYTTAHPV